MTLDWADLDRRWIALVKAKRAVWVERMLIVSAGDYDREIGTVMHVNEDGIYVEHDLYEAGTSDLDDAVPKWTDPATLGCLWSLAMAVERPSPEHAVVRNLNEAMFLAGGACGPVDPQVVPHLLGTLESAP